MATTSVTTNPVTGPDDPVTPGLTGSTPLPATASSSRAETTWDTAAVEGGLIVGGIRGAIAAVRWWFRLPATKARHRTKMKAEIEDKLPRYADDRDYRGEAIIRDLRRMDDYPELDDGIVGKPSPWFKAEVKGIYDRGLEVYVAAERVMISGDTAMPVRKGGQPVLVVGRLPFERIEEVDWVGDPAASLDRMPHFYCWFGWRRRQLYEEIVLYRQGAGVLVLLDGVNYRPARLSRREARRLNREYLENTKPARDQMERSVQAWREQGQLTVEEDADSK